LILVLATFPNREIALKVGHTLVEKRLAACVHVNGGGQSIYEWEGKICQDEEVQLWAKTEDRLWAAVRDQISSLHPIEIPQILGLSISTSLATYEEWIKRTVKSK